MWQYSQKSTKTLAFPILAYFICWRAWPSCICHRYIISIDMQIHDATMFAPVGYGNPNSNLSSEIKRSVVR